MKLLIFFAIVISVSFAYVDMGVYSRLYEIKEINIKKFIYERVAELNATYIKKSFLESMDNAFFSSVNTPESHRDITFKEKDMVVAPFDIVSPQDPSNILFRKGEQIPSMLPLGKKITLCMIDAKNILLAKAVIKEFGECDVMIANRDIRNIDFLPDRKVYPLQISYLNRFKIDRLPVKLTMYKDIVEKQYLNVTRILKQIRESSIQGKDD